MLLLPPQLTGKHNEFLSPALRVHSLHYQTASNHFLPTRANEYYLSRPFASSLYAADAELADVIRGCYSNKRQVSTPPRRCASRSSSQGSFVYRRHRRRCCSSGGAAATAGSKETARCHSLTSTVSD